MFQINSLYICVNDMDRAIMFYEDFFEQKVSENHNCFNFYPNRNPNPNPDFGNAPQPNPHPNP